MTSRPKRVLYFAIAHLVLGIAGIVFFFILHSLELIDGISTAYSLFQAVNFSLFVLLIFAGQSLLRAGKLALLLNRLYSYCGICFSAVVIVYLLLHFGTEYFFFFGLIYLGAIWHTLMLYPVLVLLFLAHSKSIKAYYR